ncbi:MAG: DNA-binding protein [Clostridiales bacterium]|nr:DNA-binding protein [Clostridiales bacterium]
MSKIELQDFVKYGSLFETYGKLLSEDRQTIMTDYFEFNMTLAEIAKEKEISRQAVLDAISKSCKKLEEFESKLHIVEKRQSLLGELQALRDLTNEELKEKVENLIRKF